MKIPMPEQRTRYEEMKDLVSHLTEEERIELKETMRSFIQRVSSENGNKTRTEVEILPEIISLYLMWEKRPKRSL